MSTKNISKIMVLARKNLNGLPARSEMASAVMHNDAGDYERAQKRALESLRLSVGDKHKDYKRALQLSGDPATL